MKMLFESMAQNLKPGNRGEFSVVTWCWRNCRPLQDTFGRGRQNFEIPSLHIDTEPRQLSFFTRASKAAISSRVISKTHKMIPVVPLVGVQRDNFLPTNKQ